MFGWQRKNYSQRCSAMLKTAPLSLCQRGCQRVGLGQNGTVFTNRYCPHQGNAVSAPEQMNFSVWGFVLCMSAFLFQDFFSMMRMWFISSQQAPVSVWHERINLTPIVSLNTFHWLLSLRLLHCFISHVTLYGTLNFAFLRFDWYWYSWNWQLY